MAPTPTPSTDPSAPSTWGSGRVVGRYTLLAKLATGGMAEIFLARQAGPKGFEKLVVVKKILETYAEDPDFVAMFLDEARIAAQLNHPNIVQIFDLGEDKGSYYIAMEYLAGESLSMVARAARKQGQPVPIPIAARLVSVSAEALHYAHKRADATGKPLGIVHRDVSPQNLFVTYDGSLKVVDFGIAKAANKASHTQDGHVKGKLSYMSPEQAKGQPVDGRADVWALGVVLFELVTRSRLFNHEEPIQTFGVLVGSDPLPRASERNPEVDPGLDEIIGRALERDPARRWATAEELHEALEDWLRQRRGPTTGAIASYMQGLFGERIAERAALVERASRGEEIPSSVNATGGKREDTDRSMPGGTDAAVKAQASSQSLIMAGVGVGLVVLLGAAGLAVYLNRPQHQVTSVVVAPTPPAAPVPQTASLTVSTEPPHAKVSVDGVERGQAPVSLADLPLGEHAILARAEGRPELSRTVKLERPGQSLEVVLNLPAPPTPTPPVQPTPPEPQGGASPPDKAEADKPRARRKGKLTLTTVPWTQVYEGSKLLGETPLVEYRLSEGSHRLRLENPEKKISTTVEVTITADELTAKKLRL